MYLLEEGGGGEERCVTKYLSCYNRDNIPYLHLFICLFWFGFGATPVQYLLLALHLMVRDSGDLKGC